MTHEYTLLLGGTVIPGGDEADGSAIAWAEDAVIAIGSDDGVRAISHGDSRIVDLQGATVIPLGEPVGAVWPVAATLEVGGPADLAVVRADPRLAQPSSSADLASTTIALVRRGLVVAGALPGIPAAPPGSSHS